MKKRHSILRRAIKLQIILLSIYIASQYHYINHYKPKNKTMKLKESGIRVESNAQQRAIFLKILAWEFMILLHIIIIDLNYYGNKFSIKLFTCCLLS